MLGVRLPVESVAVIERVSDGDTEGEAMLDAWTGLGLDGEGGVCGGLVVGWMMTAAQGDLEKSL